MTREELYQLLGLCLNGHHHVPYHVPYGQGIDDKWHGLITAGLVTVSQRWVCISAKGMQYLDKLLEDLP